MPVRVKPGTNDKAAEFKPHYTNLSVMENLVATDSLFLITLQSFNLNKYRVKLRR